MITWENYEEYLIMHADGELQPHEEQALMAFLNTHPELKSEMAIYDSVRMQPEETVTYAAKNTLLKPTGKRIIAFPAWRRYAVAAGMAAVVAISGWQWVVNSRQATNNNTQLATIAPKTNTDNQATTNTAAKKNNIQSATTKTQTADSNKYLAQSTVHVAKKQRQQTNNPIMPQANNRLQEQDNVEKLAVVKVKEIQEAPAPIALTAVTVPDNLPMAATIAKKRSLIDLLPIKEESKQQIKTITGAVADAYEDVNKARQKVNETEVTFSIQHSKLIVSF